MRHTPIRFCSTVFNLLLCLGGCVAQSADAEQPLNIVLILADDLGYGEGELLGLFGSSYVML